MHLVRSSAALVLFGALILALAAVSSNAQRLGAATATPVVDQSIVATIRAGELTLTGADLGEHPSSRAVLFNYGARTATVLSSSPLVDLWTSERIELAIPWEVVTGELRIVVDGIPSEAVEVQVFEYQQTSFLGRKAPLAVAVAPDGNVWLNQEFSSVLRSLSPGETSAFSIYDIPQAEGPGIFATTLFGGDRPIRTSVLGEDVAVDNEGRVWFTQGGDLYYTGSYPNTSRLVRYDPATGEFGCFNLPNDSAGIVGVAVDHDRGLVWYSEGGVVTGNAIGAITINSALSNCEFNPHDDDPRDPVCTAGPADGCHWRFPLPNAISSPAHIALDQDGNVWFAQFWRNSVGRLTPGTGEIIELPFPASVVQAGNGIYSGSAPWELSFDDRGDLWVTQFFDATLTRVRPSLLATENCLNLDVTGQNPCVEEVFVASNGTDLKEMHSVFAGAYGRVWFTLTDPIPEYGGRVGFVSDDDEIVFVEGMSLQFVAGITEDATTGDVWFAEFLEQSVGRLRLADAPDSEGGSQTCTAANLEACSDVDNDGDGCTDAEELGSDAQYGGRRNPANFWDFFDTPGLAGARDGDISLSEDILALAFRLGSSDANGTASVNRFSNPFAPAPDLTAYHPAFDRSPAESGAEPWALGPPDGQINLSDLLGMIYQYGHRCSGI